MKRVYNEFKWVSCKYKDLGLNKIYYSNDCEINIYLLLV